jgi:hypothetical protein
MILKPGAKTEREGEIEKGSFWWKVTNGRRLRQFKSRGKLKRCIREKMTPVQTKLSLPLSPSLSLSSGLLKKWQH